ncbi:hypothetical protein KUTeg_009126 [Tegillarca granosa]|uniref:Uncharacterized protein n=1 Tax=Tegillarca granosa TaxID=220873 RepID=A0ABQ9F7J0_TEGGR|nr:hypothetical protein KUTeg_009126 [Tegillarca granosa]
MAQRNLLEQNEPLLTEDEQFVSYDDYESLTNLKRNRRKNRLLLKQYVPIVLFCVQNKKGTHPEDFLLYVSFPIFYGENIMLALNMKDRTPLVESGLGYTSYDAIFDGVGNGGAPKLRNRLCLLVVAGILFVIGLAVALYFLSDNINTPQNPEFPPSPSILGKYKNAAVASDLPTCSNIGNLGIRLILQKFMRYSTKKRIKCRCSHSSVNMLRNTKQSLTFNARETAPLGATKDMFVKDPRKSTEGGLAIGVPGEVKGYLTVHKKYGKLKWEELFKPSIDLAKNGFKVPKHLADAFQTSKDKIQKFPEMKKTYTNPKTNKLYKEGDIIKLPKLAKTLSTLASNGESFYNGQLSKDMAQELSTEGALINSTDLKNYVVKSTNPLTIKLLDGSVLFSPPPPSGGAVLSFILNILDGFQINPENLKTKKEKLLTYHRIIEAFKFAYAKRTDLGDPDFNPANMTQLVKNLTSRSYADMTRGKIWDNTTHGIDYYGPTFYDRFTKSTAHLSIVGNDGLAVSVTSTVNTRPLSSMCPAILVDKDNKIKLVVGAAGGSRITTATAWTAARVLWFGENIKQAIDSRRLHHQLLPPFISYEPEFPQYYLDGFEKLNHNISITKLGESITNGIMRNGDYLYANCDFRREGSQPAVKSFESWKILILFFYFQPNKYQLQLDLKKNPLSQITISAIIKRDFKI